jgi:hypothetical protein
MSITIADYVLTRLAELGVRHMFEVPGQTYSENKALGGSDRFEGDPIP